MSSTDLHNAIQRIQKNFDSLQVKHTRALEEIAKLKQQVAANRTTKSRVRRIPKKDKSAAADAADTAETAAEEEAAS